MLTRIPIVALLLSLGLAAGGLAAAESVEDRIAATDMADPDALYELALFCEANRRSSSARKYLRMAVQLDPDHAPSREKMGYVYYKDSWVHHTLVPTSVLAKGGDEAAKGGSRAGEPPALVKATTPGPTAAQIDWQLQPMRHPKLEGPAATHLLRIMAGMNSSGNFTNAMDSGFRTLLMDEYWDLGTALIANGLLDGSYTDLYGPSMMVIEQRKRGDPERIEVVDRLLPYIGKAAVSSTNQEDLQFYAMMAAVADDKRHIAKLLELLQSPDKNTQRSAKIAIGKLTMIDESAIDYESAKKWWDTYHASPDAAIYGSMLGSDDPMVRLAATRKLYQSSDNRILPVLANLAGSDQFLVARGAVEMIRKITGSDWSLADFESANRGASVERFKNWVSKEGTRFVWIKDRRDGGTDLGAVAKEDASGKIQQWIAQLTSLKADEVRSAEFGLTEAGLSAAPQLIAVLQGSDILKATKARDLLRAISGLNFEYDAIRGTEADRKKAIAAWEKWLAEQEGADASE